MTDSAIKGRIYLRSGDSSLFKTKGACNVFSGLFSVSAAMPFYLLNYDDSQVLPDPTEICRVGKTYKGILYLLDAPSINIPNSIQTNFSFTKDFVFVKTKRNLTPLASVAYINYEANKTTYIAIPFSSVASIEFDYVV